MAIASAAEPGEAGRHNGLVAIASAAEPGEAGRHNGLGGASVGKMTARYGVAYICARSR